MNIVLIGFSGSGKSTVGRLLAQRLGWEFVDTDGEVERVSGKRIHRIFAEEGETLFRRLESEAVRRALQGTSRVVAVGGGAVMDPANRLVMRDGNLVVLLEAEVDTLHRRLAQATGEEPRPMLRMGVPDGATGGRGDGATRRLRTQNSEPRTQNSHSAPGTQHPALARIEALKAVRDPIYRETAHLIVSTEDVDLETAVVRVAAALKKLAGEEPMEVVRKP